MSLDIMIDLETLGTTADAPILSIGAVQFNLETGFISDITFYRVVSLESQPLRPLNRDTLVWWMNQSPEAAAIFTHQPKDSLDDALMAFSSWAHNFGRVNAWSNGADFDLPMLMHAFAQHGVRPAWEPYNGRCYRTYKNLPGARGEKVPRKGEHHNALDDAMYQAVHVCAIHRALFMPTVVERQVEVPA